VNPKVMSTNLKNNFYSQRKKDKDKYQVWITSTYIIMLSFISILLLYYVWMHNANATQWEQILQLTNQMDQLNIEKQRLDVRIAEVESLWTLEQDDHGMEAIEDPDFLVIKDNVNYVYNY
jgi:hypothetical protein